MYFIKETCFIIFSIASFSFFRNAGNDEQQICDSTIDHSSALNYQSIKTPEEFTDDCKCNKNSPENPNRSLELLFNHNIKRIINDIESSHNVFLAEKMIQNTTIGIADSDLDNVCSIKNLFELKTAGVCKPNERSEWTTEESLGKETESFAESNKFSTYKLKEYIELFFREEDTFDETEKKIKKLMDLIEIKISNEAIDPNNSIDFMNSLLTKYGVITEQQHQISANSGYSNYYDEYRRNKGKLTINGELKEPTLIVFKSMPMIRFIVFDIFESKSNDKKKYILCDFYTLIANGMEFNSMMKFPLKSEFFIFNNVNNSNDESKLQKIHNQLVDYYQYIYLFIQVVFTIYCCFFT